MRRTPLVCTAVACLAACGGGGERGPGTDGKESRVVDGGIFTLAIPQDPGNLDPQSSASSALFNISQLAYDRLLSMSPEDGSIQSGLATEWVTEGTTVTLTLAEGITCSDGAELTASDVVSNLDYVADPKNESPFLGVLLPAGATATADDTAGTVTVKLASPAPFVLQGLANLPIVCASGLRDREVLADRTIGTGPYELTEAAPGDQYTYQIRDGYTWGPDGASTEAEGMPDTIVMRIVSDESTAANLLLAGRLNGATVNGPDRERLEKAGLPASESNALIGELWFNQSEGHATSERDLRLALTQALDLDQLRKVLTSDRGTPATSIAALDPVACPSESTAGVPAPDPAAAKASIAELRPPELTLLYSTTLSSGVSAAVELAVGQWGEAGLQVKTKGQSGPAFQQTLFGTGDWDIALAPLNVNNPDQLVPFLSGPGLAEGGTNFAGIHNDEYEATVAEASRMNGQEGCDTWLEAEAHLFENADVVPFANTANTTFQFRARFEYPGQIVPTSIRMLGE